MTLFHQRVQHYLQHLLAERKSGLNIGRILLDRIRSQGFSKTLRWATEGYRLYVKQQTYSYSKWVADFDTLTDSDRAAIRQQLERLEYKPVISIIMPVYNTPVQWLEAAIESIRAQLYPYWQLCIADDASTNPDVRALLEKYESLDSRINCVYRQTNGHIAEASNSALEIATGEFIALVDHDDLIAEHALYMVALDLNRNRALDIIFSDENKIGTDGVRYEPQFKPDWNLDLMRSANFISHLGIYRTRLALGVGGFRKGFEGSQDYDIAMRCIDATVAERVGHIPFILYHWRAIEGSVAHNTGAKQYAYDAALRLIQSHLDRHAENATVELLPVIGQYRIRYLLPSTLPKVSIIVLAGDDSKALRECCSSVLNNTEYSQFEVCIVNARDNTMGSVLNAFCRDDRVRFVECDDYLTVAATLNIALAQATGEIVCLLTPNIRIRDGKWLGELVSQALRPEIGMVGGFQIKSEFNTLVHCGFVFANNQIGNHIGRGKAGGYFATDLIRDFAAVSGQCVAVRRDVLREFGGFTGGDIGNFYHVIDLCFKMPTKGYRVLWTPFSEVTHTDPSLIEHSPNPDSGVAMTLEYERLKERWTKRLMDDENLSPNLQLGIRGFELAFPPRRSFPWRAAEPPTSQ